MTSICVERGSRVVGTVQLRTCRRGALATDAAARHGPGCLGVGVLITHNSWCRGSTHAALGLGPAAICTRHSQTCHILSFLHFFIFHSFQFFIVPLLHFSISSFFIFFNCSTFCLFLHFFIFFICPIFHFPIFQFFPCIIFHIVTFIIFSLFFLQFLFPFFQKIFWWLAASFASFSQPSSQPQGGLAGQLWSSQHLLHSKLTIFMFCLPKLLTLWAQ